VSVADATRDDDLARQLRARFAGQLAAGGLPVFWRGAFEEIPRHHFMSRVFIRRSAGQGDEYVPLVAQVDRSAWLRHIYRDETVITQLDGDDTLWYAAVAAGAVRGTETCTSTQPSLMGRMLDMLDIRPGHRVLEIGTGTGYNAAVLCHRLGDTNVTSIDVDPILIENARTALAALGYRPTLAAADGRDGYPHNAPYDRITATCSLPRLPYSWVQQAAPGARIVVTLAGLLGGALLLARTSGDGTAAGRFMPGPVSFIPARPHPPGRTLPAPARSPHETPQKADTRHVQPCFPRPRWTTRRSVSSPGWPPPTPAPTGHRPTMAPC
jgi:protein-L-isoaspartate(D-aspartate) O-methyltransferase